MLVGPDTRPGSSATRRRSQAPSDGNPDNNSFTDVGAVSEPAIDLHVEKVVTSTPDVSPAGYLHAVRPITYRIQVSNNGVADAASVQLAETFDPVLPPRFTHAGAGHVLGDGLRPRHASRQVTRRSRSMCSLLRG